MGGDSSKPARTRDIHRDGEGLHSVSTPSSTGFNVSRDATGSAGVPRKRSPV